MKQSKNIVIIDGVVTTESVSAGAALLAFREACDKAGKGETPKTIIELRMDGYFVRTTIEQGTL